MHALLRRLLLSLLCVLATPWAWGQAWVLSHWRASWAYDYAERFD